MVYPCGACCPSSWCAGEHGKIDAIFDRYNAWLLTSPVQLSCHDACCNPPPEGVGTAQCEQSEVVQRAGGQQRVLR